MSEPPDAPSGEPEVQAADDFQWPQVDPLLEVLASLVHNDTAEIPVTLYVQGTVVTGTLVSRRKWLDAYLDAATGEAAKSMVQALKDGLGWHEKDEAEEERDAPIAFLHLVGAQIVHSHGLTPPTPQSNSFWRGRLTEVSAWQHGALTMAMPD